MDFNDRLNWMFTDFIVRTWKFWAVLIGFFVLSDFGSVLHWAIKILFGV
jgi:hypothetical protein